MEIIVLLAIAPEGEKYYPVFNFNNSDWDQIEFKKVKIVEI